MAEQKYTSEYVRKPNIIRFVGYNGMANILYRISFVQKKLYRKLFVKKRNPIFINYIDNYTIQLNNNNTPNTTTGVLFSFTVASIPEIKIG